MIHFGEQLVLVKEKKVVIVVQSFPSFFLPLGYLFKMNANLGFTVLLLTLGFVPHIIAGPLWSKELAQTQGFKNLLKTVGSKWTCCYSFSIIIFIILSMTSLASLCKAAYDDSNPNAVAETMRTWGEVDEAQIETVKDFFKRFGCT